MLALLLFLLVVLLRLLACLLTLLNGTFDIGLGISMELRVVPAAAITLPAVFPAFLLAAVSVSLPARCDLRDLLYVLRKTLVEIGGGGTGAGMEEDIAAGSGLGTDGKAFGTGGGGMDFGGGN